MEIKVNGERKNIEDNRTVSRLLSDFQINSKVVVVEVNLSIVKKENYDSTLLKDGDTVEIVKFMGGGQPTKCAE